MKIEKIKSILTLLTHNCYVAKVDIKESTKGQASDVQVAYIFKVLGVLSCLIVAL